MRRQENLFLGILAIGIIVLVVWQPRATWWLQNFLLSGLNRAPVDINNLQTENVSLKSRLAVLEDIKAQLPEWSPEYARAMVYSRYPFNLKNELLISVGREDGINPGSPVFFNEVLVGRIDRVFTRTSLVKTIFDAKWQSAVRIGTRGIEGLLVGGNDPRITLIDKKAEIGAADPVYNAHKDFPYGAPVAAIKQIGPSSDQLFKEATLYFSYQMNDIRTVLVLTNHVSR